MKTFLKLFGTLFGVFAAGLFGNWVGDQLRARATGEKPAENFVFSQGGEGEETVIAIKPNVTNFVPAVLAGAALRPHVAWAFLGGVLASGFLGSTYEQKVKDYLKAQMPEKSE